MQLRNLRTRAWQLGLLASVIGCANESDGHATGQTEAPKGPVSLVEGAIAESYTTAPLRTELLNVTDGSDHDAIEVAITNTSAQSAEVWLELEGGLGIVRAARSYASQALAPGEQVVLEVAASELPLQTAALPVNFVIAAGYRLQDGPDGRLIAGDVLGRSSRDLQSVALTSAQGGFNHTLSPGAFEGGLVGRRFDEQTRKFVDLEPSALGVGSNVQVLGFGSDLDAVDELPEGASIHEVRSENDKAASTKFCVKMSYSITDAGQGEDRLVTNTGTIPAAFVRVNILRSGSSTLLVQGFLDAAGCTSSISTPAGSYVVRLFSRLGRDGKELWAYDDENDTSLGNWSTTVSISSSSASTFNVTVNPSSDYGAFLAVGSTALAALPEAIFGTTYFYINQGCSTSPACASPTLPRVYFGTDGNGQRLVRQKFVLAHELGHNVQRTNWGFMDTSGSNFKTPTCNCDHVPIGSTNRIHCMQSREKTEMAQGEGFGHYFAARVFNFASLNSDCRFGYYKQFLSNGTVFQPPVAIDCRQQYAWNRNVCGADPNYPNTGVELDWLSFYWGVTTTSASFDFATLRLLYIKACSPSCSGDATCFSACRGKRVNALMLENAAISIWGQGSWQHIHVGSHLYTNVL